MDNFKWAVLSFPDKDFVWFVTCYNKMLYNMINYKAGQQKWFNFYYSTWQWTHLVRPKHFQWSHQIFHRPCQFLSWNTKRPIDYFQHQTERTTTSYRSLEESSRKLCGLRRNLLHDRFFFLILTQPQSSHYHMLPDVLTTAELQMNSLVLGLRFRECSLQQNFINWKSYHVLWTYLWLS